MTNQSHGKVTEQGHTQTQGNVPSLNPSSLEHYSPTDVEKALLHVGSSGFVAETLNPADTSAPTLTSDGQQPVGGFDSGSFPIEMDADTIDFAATSHSRNNSIVIRLDANSANSDTSHNALVGISPEDLSLNDSGLIINRTNTPEPTIPLDSQAITPQRELQNISPGQQNYSPYYQNNFTNGSSKPPPELSRYDNRPVRLVADVYPDEIEAGLNEIVLHCPHKNFSLGTSMTEESSDEAFNVIPIAFLHENRFLHGKSTVEAISISRLAEYIAICPDLEKLANISSDSSTPSYNFQTFIIVQYGRKIDAFRALGSLLSSVLAYPDANELVSHMNWEETTQFDTSGIMADNSRCAVLTLPSIFFLLRTNALLGMNTFQLYTEDTYEIKDEPFFGYLRGRFSEDELRTIDDYAFNLGIEIFACIQTLGHLGQILQWPRFANLKDTHEVLLAEFDETYDLLERMIESATKPLRSKRIHIGMDEAHGVGEGRYRQLFGFKDSTDVFLSHIKRVNDICKKKGLIPMIWSDMLFSLAAKDNSLQSYYGESSLPTSIKKKLPDDISLVYWDYYHIHEEAYAKKIQHHRELGYEPWMAGGIWTWNRFVTALPFTIAAATACLRASKHENVRNIFVTTWGDDGNEVDIMSALPGLVLYGEHTYTSNDDILIDVLKCKFAALCGGNFDDFIYASKVDLPPGAYDRTRFPPNMSKWLLWQDPFYAFLTPQAKGIDLENYYNEIASTLEESSVNSTTYPLNYRLKFPALLAKVLSKKVNIRSQLESAYMQINPRESLEIVLRGPLLELCKSIDELWRYHRSLWLATYKPFGLEILEMRYGAIRTRLQSMFERVFYYCYGKYPSTSLTYTNVFGNLKLDDSPIHQNINEKNDSGLDLLLNGIGRSSVGSNVGTIYEKGDPLSNKNDEETQLPNIINQFPEFKTPLNELYGGGVEVVLEFARAYTPARGLGTG